MKIKIMKDDVKFSIYLPLCAIKSKSLWKFIVKEENEIKIKEVYPIICGVYKELKRFRKIYANFVLMEVNGVDGELVQFIV